MAESKEIEIEIDEETGEIRMETFCVEGNDCTAMLDALQEALMAEEIETIDKPEKFSAEKTTQKNKLYRY